jgi:host factor-I protein
MTIHNAATQEGIMPARVKSPEKPPQNIQDGFLNSARKEKLVVTVYLLSGVKLTGRIRSFDKFSMILESNGHEQLIFKHAISTVLLPRPGAAPARPAGAGQEG